MTKGYWLSTGSVNDGEGMQPYLKTIHDWLPSINGEFFARGLANIDNESNFAHRTLIFEIPSKEDTFAAYEPDEYQR